MCGVIGILSSECDIKFLMCTSLGKLLNRGYDSMGCSMIVKNTQNGDFEFVHIRTLDRHVLFKDMKNVDSMVSNCIAHTRWATHGGVCVENAHPHIDALVRKISIVHNGIIENYDVLKKNLVEKGVVFRSETDSEVIVNMTAYAYTYIFHSLSFLHERFEKSILYTLSHLQGTYGLIFQHVDLPHLLYVSRLGSPIQIGMNTEHTLCMIVSEKSGFSKSVTLCKSIKDHSVYKIQKIESGTIQLFSLSDHDTSMNHLSVSAHDTVCDFLPYTSFTEKEIFEQSNALIRCFNNGSRFGRGCIHLGGLESVAHELKECRQMYIFGCGTSFHTALLARLFFLETGYFDIVMAFDGSEFEYDELPKTRFRSCCLFITQSGETLDLYVILKHFRQDETRFLTIGIVNVVDSLIATTVHAGVYMNCLAERAVASTKSFTNSVLLSWMIAQWFSPTPSLDSLIYECLSLPSIFHSFIKDTMVTLKTFVQTLLTNNLLSILVIGRGKDFIISKEACLKIKELSYIHAEAYSSSSLKHGPFALLEKNRLVVFIATDSKYYVKASNSFHEVYARNPQLFLLCTPTFRTLLHKDLKNVFHMNVPDQSWSFLFANIVMQCFALVCAQHKGIDPDFPRNLAKVVTVE
jgi:glucosamine--fructose-6-phosphate aminotransferase (isomerizing)